MKKSRNKKRNECRTKKPGFWQLLGAYSIDILLVVLVLLLLLFLLAVPLFVVFFNAFWNNATGPLVVFCIAGCIFVGWVVFSIGIGKSIMGIREVQDTSKKQKRE